MAIVFVSHNRVRVGKESRLPGFFLEMASAIEADKPGTLAFHGYMSADGSEASFVHIFPDATAMERHMDGLAERARRSAELAESVAMEVYGQLSPMLTDMFTHIAKTGVRVQLHPRSLGGYTRLAAGRRDAASG